MTKPKPHLAKLGFSSIAEAELRHASKFCLAGIGRGQEIYVARVGSADWSNPAKLSIVKEFLIPPLIVKMESLNFVIASLAD